MASRYLVPSEQHRNQNRIDTMVNGGKDAWLSSMVGGRSGILSRRNRSEWKLRHGSQGTERRLLIDSFVSFSFVCSFPIATYDGRRGEEEPESRVEPEPETIVCMLRAFDFSRRNDYAIISRRVPFLLKRKTSPFSLALPSLYVISRACLFLVLFLWLPLSMPLSLSLNRRYILSSRFVLTSHRAGSMHFRPTGQPLHTPLTHLDPTKGSSRLFESIFIIGISPRVCISMARCMHIISLFAYFRFRIKAWNFDTIFHLYAWINWTLILI